MLADITAKSKVDRPPIPASSKGVEKLLVEPKLKHRKSGTSLKAVVEILNNWSLKNSVVGLWFVTTSSNADRNGEACLLAEQSLTRNYCILLVDTTSMD